MRIIYNVDGVSVHLETTFHDRRPPKERPTNRQGAGARRSHPAPARAHFGPLAGAARGVTEVQFIYAVGAIAGAAAAGGFYWICAWWLKRRR